MCPTMQLSETVGEGRERREVNMKYQTFPPSLLPVGPSMNQCTDTPVDIHTIVASIMPFYNCLLTCTKVQNPRRKMQRLLWSRACYTSMKCGGFFVHTMKHCYATALYRTMDKPHFLNGHHAYKITLDNYTCERFGIRVFYA